MRRRGDVKPSKFKTTLCQFHLKGEGCPFGEKCAFAHGEDELRPEVEVVPKTVKQQPQSLPPPPPYHCLQTVSSVGRTSSILSSSVSSNDDEGDDFSPHRGGLLMTTMTTMIRLPRSYRNNPYDRATGRCAVALVLSPRSSSPSSSTSS